MNKNGLSALAAIVLGGAAFGGTSGLIYGGEAAQMGTFTGAQIAAMRGVTAKDSALFSTDWTSDSNGSTYTVGNVGTSIAGTTPGQGGWYTYSSNGTSTAYKVISTSTIGRTGQGISIQNAAGAGAYRYMYQDLSAQWAARNAGDDILWAEYQQYMTSTASTSANMGGVSLYNSSYNILAGMAAGYGSGISGYAQRSVYGLAYYTDTSTGTSGNYFFRLSGTVLSDGSTAPLAKAGFTNYLTSFNRTTGEVNWFYSIDGGATYTGFFVDGAAAGADLMEIDLEVSNMGASSNSQATAVYGDVAVYATPAPGAAALVGLAGLMARRRRA